MAYYQTARQRRKARDRRENIEGLFMVGYAAFIGLVTLAMMGGFALVLLNWAMGCGEVFYYPDGTWTTGECLLIPYETTSGTW